MSESGARSNLSLGRRAFLGSLGVGAGLALTGGLPRWLGRPPHPDLGFQECLGRLDASLTPKQRALTVRPFDHPARQLTNTVNIFKGPHIGTLFDAEQVALVERLYETMVSSQGRSWLNDTITLEGKLSGCVLAIFSDADASALSGHARTQAMITGAHLMLRQGGEAESGYAFGGPIAYGQQIGNGAFKVEGNAFAAQGDAANRFFESLDPQSRRASRAATPPNELMVQPQGAGARLPGVALSAVPGAARELAQEWLDTILATYEAPARADALSCIEDNGGLEALHVSFYEDRGFYADGKRFSELTPEERDARELPYWQVWRIEGPGSVMHFKGYPHVHAYIDVVRDPKRQAVGETLTRVERPLDASAVRRLLHAALRAETNEPLAFVPAQVPGRVNAGDVTTGVAYTLDPFDDPVVVATIRGAAMAEPLRLSFDAPIDPDASYRVASLAYPASRRDVFGVPERVDVASRSLRTALIDFLRGRDLSEFAHV